ncbi:MAG: hypothetical protein ACTTJK_09555 [Phocaeicola sp.]|uniref:hypothetical protein n=1 Tax=Phocaeicola sp. TaxID=2773926 RepID=UPI003FA0052B
MNFKFWIGWEKREWGIFLIILIVTGGIATFVHRTFFGSKNLEFNDELGGNVFPVTILSTATTDCNLIEPVDSDYVGNPKSCISIKLKSSIPNSRVMIQLAETPYFSKSISEFILPKAERKYTIYPDVVWNYDALRNNKQAAPVALTIQVNLNGHDLPPKVKNISMRSINECPIGYYDRNNHFHDTSKFFAAYVNEEHPKIDELLREALDTRIINRFLGYQGTLKEQAKNVDNQVYALWNILQKRNFKYSSVTNTSLSSNIVFAQRVRTLDDALESSQINCVDGSVLMASLLKAININPILIRLPGHMFVGYYTDKTHKAISFMEMTMIGDVDLDDFFPDEKLDSTRIGKTQNQISKLTFEKSKEYATKMYLQNDSLLHAGKANYMFLEIDKKTRARIQPIGK